MFLVLQHAEGGLALRLGPSGEPQLPAVCSGVCDAASPALFHKHRDGDPVSPLLLSLLAVSLEGEENPGDRPASPELWGHPNVFTLLWN